MKKEKFKKYFDSSTPHRVEWFFVIVVGVLLGCCYLYNDIAFTSSCGVKFWNCVVEKTVPMFYYAGYEGAKGSILESSMGGSYDFALYFVFALYDFPLWVWEKITGFSFMQFVLTREYIKGIVWIFSGISAYLLYRIALECGVEEKEAKWCPFLFMTSSVFFYTEVVIGGYDVISVAFTLVGIYGYLKKNNKCFIAAFAVAIAMKMFAIFLFIPLVLLREKRIWKILVSGLEGISVLVIPKIYFAIASHRFMLKQAIEDAALAGEEISTDIHVGYATNEIIAHADSIVNNAIFPQGREAEYTFITMDTLPLLFVGMFAVWFFCYLYKKELNNRNIIYLCALTMSIFVLTVKLHPQWCIILIPYLVLIIMFHPERMKDNLILEGVFGIGYVLNKAIIYRWTCNLNMIENMIKPQHSFSYGSSDMTGNEYGLSYYIARLSEKIGISESNFSYMFKALALVGLVMFLIWNYPGRKEQVEKTTISYQERRKWLFARFVVSCLVGMLPMVGLVVYLT